MENYIQQLIEDLETVAKNPPKPYYIEPPSHIADDPVISELALVPFKTIEELTGIKQESFPEIIHLKGDQWQRVNDAIFKVFESLHIELVDAPPGIPPEGLYEVLTTNWQHPVQYLPSSGMDLELCTGDPMTCPYGDYCDCGEDFDEYELPEKFTPIINPIAQSIDAGFICYLNPETLEMEDVPKSLMDDPDEFEMTTGFALEKEELKHESWDECYVFEPLNSDESFRIMETFAANVEDEILQEQLFYVLSRKKPFANFKEVIYSSGLSDDWFHFKMNWLEDHVKQIIYSEIHKMPENFDNNDLPF
ncbi:MAG: UPF0158 family protein [Mariniphaga sp.]